MQNFRIVARIVKHCRSFALFSCCAMFVAACGGGGGATGGGQADAAPIDLAMPGVAIVKLRAAQDGWIALSEKLRPVEPVATPERRLLFADDGKSVSASFEAPAGWSLIDFALHPSREASAVLATNKALRLVRLDRAGRVLSQTDFADPGAPTDPFVGDSVVIRDSHSMLPFATRDAVRLAPIGEDLALAVRTGRNAVVAYRLSHAAGGFSRVWRTLVEPGVFIGILGITSGSFDPFGGLDNQFRVLLDADAAGRIAVAISIAYTEHLAGHAAHFGEPLPSDLAGGVLVTALAPDGHRLGTALIDTVQRSEAHALRWIGDDVAVAGRVLSERLPDGSGWNAYLGIVRPASGQVLSYRPVDVERGDVIFDMARLPDGRLLAAGSSGYTQNPFGGSISEESTPLLAVLEADGRVVRRLSVAAGPRQNQLRSLAPRKDGWLFAGLRNGPGTHSADGNPALLTADGLVRGTRLSAP
ncbi:MAG TPA: hypothetical protein VEC06_08665 [Paucimonas sp.]|nr:hypothetical protein [Paucimonas sp.]